MNKIITVYRSILKFAIISQVQSVQNSRSMLILWVSVTCSNTLLLVAWQVTTTKCWSFGMTKDTFDFVIQLDCGAATTVEVLFFSGSPATVHLTLEGGLLRAVSQLRFTTSPCFASSGPLIRTLLEPSERKQFFTKCKLFSKLKTFKNDEYYPLVLCVWTWILFETNFSFISYHQYIFTIFTLSNIQVKHCNRLFLYRTQLN